VEEYFACEIYFLEFLIEASGRVRPLVGPRAPARIRSVPVGTLASSDKRRNVPTGTSGAMRSLLRANVPIGTLGFPGCYSDKWGLGAMNLKSVPIGTLLKESKWGNANNAQSNAIFPTFVAKLPEITCQA
jgi:hypothetical protein